MSSFPDLKNLIWSKLISKTAKFNYESLEFLLIPCTFTEISYKLFERMQCNFFLSFNWRFPFNWKNPTGYLLAFILMYILYMHFFYFLTSCFLFGCGVYILITALTKDIKNKLKAFSDIVGSKRKKKMNPKRIVGFIEFHSSVKRCVRQLNNSIGQKVEYFYIF